MTQCVLEINDRIAITDLLTAYSWAIDEGQAEALAELFLPEGQFIGSDGSAIRGRDALVAFASRVHGAHPGRVRHVISNLVFVPEASDRVTVRSYVQVLLAESTGPRLLALGSYRDEVVQSDGDWLFASRSFVSWRGEAEPGDRGRPSPLSTPGTSSDARKESV